MSEWQQSQLFEAEWWGGCFNTYGEETKQLVYADRMGLTPLQINGQGPYFDLKGKNVLDLGGGPVSLLLKTINGKNLTVVDPCRYPPWIDTRYQAANINYTVYGAENYITDEVFDECWIYNVLQHVIDPESVIITAKKYSKLVRIFEWINVPAHDGHPHELFYTDLIRWLGGDPWLASVSDLNENGCVGRAFYGVFPTDLTDDRWAGIL